MTFCCYYCGDFVVVLMSNICCIYDSHDCHHDYDGYCMTAIVL